MSLFAFGFTKKVTNPVGEPAAPSVKREITKVTKPSSDLKIRPKKRLVIVDSDEEYEPVKEVEMEEDEDEDEDDEVEIQKPVITPMKKKVVSPTVSTPISPPTSPTASTPMDAGDHEHHRLPWLQKDIRDSRNRRCDDPNYDPSTLSVPKGYLDGVAAFHAEGNARKITPGMKDWWKFKAQLNDCVIFYKVGKFYELYHMDADVGVRHINLLYMRGEFAHCGFPEPAYGKYSEQLVERGFRVARVEQTETPEQMRARTGKSSGNVRREICGILSPGTRTLSIRDGIFGKISATRVRLLCLYESAGKIGLCILDPTVGRFYLGSFQDGPSRHRLRMLLSRESFAEIAYLRNGLEEPTMTMLKSMCPENIGQTNAILHSPIGELPEMVPGRTFADSVTESAFRVCLSILQRARIDHQMLTMNDFQDYVLPGEDEERPQEEGGVLTLDGQALANLEVLTSLLDYLDRCQTKFGKRLLREWLASPLQAPKEIKERQQQVLGIMRMIEQSDVIPTIRTHMKRLPDLERMLSRIHAIGLATSTDDHPDARAVLYETQKYNKTKIESLIDSLTGMRSVQHILSLVTDEPSLQHLQCPDMTPDLDFFDRSFDAAKAKESGAIIPNRGLVIQYDNSCDEVTKVHQLLEEELAKEKKALQTNFSGIKFWHPATGKDKYQIEVPDKANIKTIPSHFIFMTKKSGCRRYHTKTIQTLVAELTKAEAEKERQAADCTRLVFEQFDQKRELWKKALQSVMQLDCLISLALVSGESSPMCVPEIVSGDDHAILELRESRHPCVALSVEKTGGSFIPNDLSLGTDGGSCILLTGPNMGGKSTLLRQACVAVVMAQLGCLVPAESCRLSPVDRIFTRLGASDRIMMGHSTFFVELDETATILNHATKRSLVILDELGRGTSTFDGTAIAYAVVEKLCEPSLQCRTIFATHYHSLVQEFKENHRIVTKHMSCFANQNDSNVTFLYKLADGPSDKSHGMNVARLAKLPEEIVDKAQAESETFEKTFLIEQLYSEMCQEIEKESCDVEALKRLQERAVSLC